MRRRRMRRTANWMIILAVLGLVAIVLYFVGTWLYAAKQQNALAEELARDNPGLATAEQSVDEGDFVSADTLIQSVAGAAAQAAEAERAEQLAALKSAAEAYHRTILGRVGKAIGKISIPSIGVESVMVEGNFQQFNERYLRKGPGHWPETPIPGEGGSVVVSGHRTTYGAPFRKLDQLVPGDEVELTMPYAIIRYSVTQVIIVEPEDVEVVADMGEEMLSLVACHPLYSATQRIIAQCEMTSFVLLED